MTQTRVDTVVHAPLTSDAPVARPMPFLTLLFAATAFLGAALLFVVQPMVAKLLLPSYGGSATVWSTSSLFFQVLLLAAYWYVHLSTTRLGPRRQPRLHLVLLALPALALPVVLPSGAAPSDGTSPTFWLLRTLVLMIGLPFAVIATTGPSLQRWFSWSGHRRAHDPYFLFAASNLGSFGGLLAYPFFIEPNVSLVQQRSLWSWAFLVFALLTAACALTAKSTRNSAPNEEVKRSSPSQRVPRRRLLIWISLAFLPSTLMLGVTAHISTDIAAIPLLWVVPLAIYLATFVLAFSRTSRTAPVVATRAAVAAGLLCLTLSLAPGALNLWWLIALDLLLLTLVGFAAHGRLAADRPPTEQLTTFYLSVALGGAMGGVLNGLVAPVLFNRLIEYQIAIVAVPLLMVGLHRAPSNWLMRQYRANRIRSAMITLAVLIVVFALLAAVASAGSGSLLALSGILGLLVVGWLASALGSTVVVVSSVLLGITLSAGSADIIERSRSFFGSYSVRDGGGAHTMAHGTTVHGSQFWDPAKRRIPTTYYSQPGPLGEVFESLDDNRFNHVAAVGLGTGTLAAYGREGQTITFFEIDPDVVSMAREPHLFSYLSDSRAQIETVVGDGRLRVAEHAEGAFDLLVLDAFSSDSIPVHLLTQEAVEIYSKQLSSDGVLLVHISNRVFDLEPVLASTAEHLNWQAAIGREEGRGEGATPSVWVALSRDINAVETLLAKPNWSELDDRQVQWTDDYSSFLSVLR